MKKSAVRRLPQDTYLRGKRALVRADFNVHVERGRVMHDLRLRRSLPTLKKIIPLARYTLVVSHRGSFEKPNDSSETLEPVARHLSRLIRRRVYFLSGSLESVSSSLKRLPHHAIALLENIRWYGGERENSLRLAKQLSGLADVYINDAFGESHRRESSIIGITKFLPGFAGLLLHDELQHLDGLSGKPARPFVVVLGGAKLQTKLPLIKRFLKVADSVLVGTALANTFIAAQGNRIGRSLADKKFVRQARSLLRRKNLLLPQDYLAARRIDRGRGRVVVGDVSNNELIVDIGPRTIKEFTNVIRGARTIFWNGPMGCFEHQPFSRGSRAIARAILNNKRARKVVGGGDTLELVGGGGQGIITAKRDPVYGGDRNLFISTGGGAMVQYLSGKKLPGIEALKSRV